MLHAPHPTLARPAPHAIRPPAELGGRPDGPDLMLPSGVRIRRLRVAGRSVTADQLAQAIRGVQLLPAAHQQVVARAGIAIELLPVAQLEHVPGHQAPMLGATATETDAGGFTRPTRLRIAVASPLGAVNPRNSIAEVTQHEIGHVLAVLAYQDQSEQAAIAYADRY